MAFRIVLPFLLVALTFVPVTAKATDGETILAERCASCHALSVPSERGRARVLNRKGPDLFYAGSKYKQGWVAQWIAAPTSLRPSGGMGFSHLKRNSESLAVGQPLGDHPTLTGDEATAVETALFTRIAPASVIRTDLYTPGEYDPEEGEGMFVKRRGCGFCHVYGDNKGGGQGPELTTAGKRLTSAYIASFIDNPQAFTEGAWMPRQFMGNAEVGNMTAFIESLSGE